MKKEINNTVEKITIIKKEDTNILYSPNKKRVRRREPMLSRLERKKVN